MRAIGPIYLLRQRTDSFQTYYFQFLLLTNPLIPKEEPAHAATSSIKLLRDSVYKNVNDHGSQHSELLFQVDGHMYQVLKFNLAVFKMCLKMLEFFFVCK
jgi:hypothetical protein